VAYIGTHVQTATATVPYHGSVSVTLRDMQVDGSTVLTNVTTASVTNGNLTGLNLQAGNFVPPTITYNHTANSCANGTFTYRGTGSASTTTRSATVSVTAPAPPVANASTSNI